MPSAILPFQGYKPLLCGLAQIHLFPFTNPFMRQHLSMDLLLQEATLQPIATGIQNYTTELAKKTAVNGNSSNHKCTKICFLKINSGY